METMASNNLSPFSERDIQIIEFAAIGLTDRTISDNLGLAPTTIATYWKRLFKKTGCGTRTQVVARYCLLKSENERALLSSQVTALTLYCHKLEGKSTGATSDVLPKLIESVEDLRHWLKTPSHHVIGSSSFPLELHESQLSQDRIDVILAAAQILTERIGSLFAALDEAVITRIA